MAKERKLQHIFLLSPISIYYSLFFLIPMGILFIYSFWIASVTRIVPTFTLTNYLLILTKPLYRTVLIRSIGIGLITATICVIAGYPLAYALTFKYKKLQDVVLFCHFSRCRIKPSKIFLNSSSTVIAHIFY